MDWYVYIVKCIDNTYYTGITTDVIRRIKQHNLGKGARYTAQRKPVKLVWLKMLNNQNEARRQEIVIKDWRREKKEELIKNISSIDKKLLLSTLVDRQETSPLYARRSKGPVAQW